jgi:predicted hotdog family 3-hydroxylacyl-ACP dehydratase
LGVTVLATRNDITQYIPQRDPMVMVHNILQVKDDSAITEFEVLPDNVFVKEGFLREPGLLENIAQTAAAQMGYTHIKQGLSIPIGYIASIKDLRVVSLPPAGILLNTSVQVINQVMNIIQIEGLVKSDGKVICRCEMSIFVKSNLGKSLT